MEVSAPATKSSALHPVFWMAGISVTLLSLAGIASLTGLLPARPAPAPERPAIVATVPAAEPPPTLAAAAPAPAAMPPAQEGPVSKAPAAPAVTHKPAKKKIEKEIPPGPAAMPPPLASGVPPDYVPPPEAAPAPPAAPACANCGVVANVRQVTREGQGTGAGAIVGGLAGGALASNIGRGNTRTLATIAGAVGGGLLGNSIEKSQRKTVAYEIIVRMEDGSSRTIASETVPPWRIDEKIRLVNGAIVAR